MAFHGKFLVGLLLACTLTCAPPAAFPAPQNREEALAGLEDSVTEKRAEAVVWISNHGRPEDQPLLMKRLRDESAFVRGFAEQGLWLLWSRSGDADIDRQMAEGVAQMQAGRHKEAIATFTQVIKRRPAFAEAWNKRATAHYLAGDMKRSLADCDEVEAQPRAFRRAVGLRPDLLPARAIRQGAGILEEGARGEPQHAGRGDQHQGRGRIAGAEAPPRHLTA